MNNIATNIKTLRLEARLSVQELAEITNIPSEKITLFEKGKLEPTTEELEILCKPLRIHYEDMIERDILAERNEAGKKMKTSRDRKNYNWYLGDKKIFWLYFGYLLASIFMYSFLVLFVYLFTKEGISVEVEGTVEIVPIPFIFVILIAYVFMSIPTGICILIWLAIKLKYHFTWWHLFFYSLIIAICVITGLIGLIPSWGYSFYKSVIKKGRN